MFIFICYSGAPCAVVQAALSFDAPIATKNTIFLVLGCMVTVLVSSFNLRVVSTTFLRHGHANATALLSRFGITVVMPLQPRSKARQATWCQSCVAKNTT